MLTPGSSKVERLSERLPGSRLRRADALLIAVAAVLSVLSNVALHVPAAAVIVGAVAFIGVVRVGVTLLINRKELETERSRARRFTRVEPGPLTEISPEHVGVDIAVPGQILKGQPRYLARIPDRDIDQAISGALSGASSRLIIVSGPSKIGKSRTLFEALRRSIPSATLIAPVDTDAIRAITMPGGPLRIEEPSVLWLDDLEPFTDQGLTPQLIREWFELCPGSLVVGTLGGKGGERISKPGPTASIGAELVAMSLEVPMRKTTPSELSELTRDLAPAVKQELIEHGLAAFLVAGPQLRRKLATGRHDISSEECPEGLAFASALIDWARCGRTGAASRQTALRLWHQYLPAAHQGDEAALQRAVAWATRPVAGTVALIRPAGETFVAFDYAVELGDAHGTTPPQETWRLALQDLTPAEATSVGERALTSEHREIALRAFSVASASEDSEVAAIGTFNCGVMHNELDRPQAAAEAWRTAIDLADISTPSGRRLAAFANANLGMHHVDREESNSAFERLDAATALTRTSEDPELAEVALRCATSKAQLLSRENRPEAAIRALDEVPPLSYRNTTTIAAPSIARACVARGAALAETFRHGEAIACYLYAYKLATGSTHPVAPRQAAQAAGRAGSLYARVYGDHEQALAALIASKDALAGTEFSVDHAQTEVEAAAELAALDRPAEALLTLAALHASCRQVHDDLFNPYLARGLMLEAILRAGEEPAEAIRLLETIVSSYGEDPRPAVRESVGRALLFRSVLLRACDRDAEADQDIETAFERDDPGVRALIPVIVADKPRED